MTFRILVPANGTVALPDELVANLREVHGERTDAWLSDLGPMLGDLLDDLEARLVPGDPPLSYHLVVFVERSTGEQLVVKCTVPNDEQPPELAAVQALCDAGIGPRLLWSDLDRGVLVMERVMPGSILPTSMPALLEDAGITRLVAALAARIHSETIIDPWRNDLVPVEEYSRALGEVDTTSTLWQHHHEEIELASELRSVLLSSPDRQDVLLHGDLHHYNVLQDALKGPRVIDAKGLVGPPGYEFGAFIYNPVGIHHHSRLVDIQQQRIDIWSEVTGLDWQTVRSWGYVAAVVSACWSGQGGGMHWKGAMTIAQTLRDLEPLS